MILFKINLSSRSIETIKVLPSSCLTSVMRPVLGDTTPRETFTYGRAKSTCFLRSSVTVKLARVTSTLFEIKYSARLAASTEMYLTLTPRS